MSSRKKPRPDIPIAAERKSGVDRRKTGSVLRKQFWASDAADYTADQVEFMKAVDNYKRVRGRPFPTWAEVLSVAISLGYRKVAEPSGMPERPDAPSAPSARK